MFSKIFVSNDIVHTLSSAVSARRVSKNCQWARHWTPSRACSDNTLVYGTKYTRLLLSRHRLGVPWDAAQWHSTWHLFDVTLERVCIEDKRIYHMYRASTGSYWLSHHNISIELAMGPTWHIIIAPCYVIITSSLIWFFWSEWYIIWAGRNIVIIVNRY